MAAFLAAARRLSGILRPLNSLATLASNSSCSAPLVSGLSIRHINHGQMAITCPRKPLASANNLSYGQPASLFNRIAPLLPSHLQPPARTVTYFSWRSGKRKTVKAVVYRFLRLHCGLWLRRRAGYKKKLWKKSPQRKKRLREHVFCNRTQSKLLDKMTTSFWKRRNWYVNDPYLKYHDRTNL
uniref:Large ribosomal subunit protein bL35m n=1 Tax=Sphenodon punctatus TaxID=8508 RepID=A0A8D0GJL1_SPHPU